MCSVKRSTYNNWLKNKAAREARAAERKKNDDRLKEEKPDHSSEQSCINVPGARTFAAELKRKGIQVSRKRIARLMQEMNLHPQSGKPGDFITAARPRTIIPAQRLRTMSIRTLSSHRAESSVQISHTSSIILNPRRITSCIFRDAYTKEILGWAESSSMDIQLVTEACEMMMKNHGREFKHPKVFVQKRSGQSVYVLCLQESA